VANKLNTNWSGYQEGDYVINDYKFISAESSPEVTLHYRTIGTAKKNSAGEVVNAVLLLQGNTGTGANWFRPTLADELYKTGEPLDAAKSGASRPGQPHQFDVALRFPFQPPARLEAVEVAVEVNLRQRRGMIGRPARRRLRHP
jgi:hypothetical protein